MAERFPIEGLDYLLGVVPRGGSAPATLFLGLFTSQSALTVPADTAVLATQAGVTEATGTGYTRVAIPAASWGTPTIDPVLGRRVTASAVTFPTVAGAGWGTINGLFVSNTATAGVAVFYANFDDLTAIVSQVNDVITVVPYMTFQP